MAKHGNSNRNNAAALSRRIAEVTHDGEEMMRVMVAIMRDQEAPTSERRAAAEWLTDRFAGKAPIVIEHDVVHSGPMLDVSAVSVQELRELERTLTKMLPAGQAPALAGVQSVIDIEDERGDGE